MLHQNELSRTDWRRTSTLRHFSANLEENKGTEKGALPRWSAGASKQRGRRSRLTAAGSEWREGWKRTPVEWGRWQTSASKGSRARRSVYGGVWVRRDGARWTWFWFSPEARDRAILVSIGDRNRQTVSKSESKWRPNLDVGLENSGEQYDGYVETEGSIGL